MADKLKHKTAAHNGPDNSAPYPVSRMAPSFDLVELAEQISKADESLHHQVHGKLKVIAEQIAILQEQAKDILTKAQHDQMLHRAQCNFQRQPGKIYHLYQKSNSTSYFSMLSPNEWGSKPPHQYLGSYRLEADLSWTPLEEISQSEQSQAILDKLLLLKNED